MKDNQIYVFAALGAIGLITLAGFNRKKKSSWLKIIKNLRRFYPNKKQAPKGACLYLYQEFYF